MKFFTSKTPNLGGKTNRHGNQINDKSEIYSITDVSVSDYAKSHVSDFDYRYTLRRSIRNFDAICSGGTQIYFHHDFLMYLSEKIEENKKCGNVYDAIVFGYDHATGITRSGQNKGSIFSLDALCNERMLVSDNGREITGNNIELVSQTNPLWNSIGVRSIIQEILTEINTIDNIRLPSIWKLNAPANRKCGYALKSLITMKILDK